MPVSPAARSGAARVSALTIALCAMRGEPGAEPCAAGVVLPAINRFGNRCENLLREIIGIGGLQATADGEPLNDRRVDFREFAPGSSVVAIDEPNEQAGAGFGRRRHGEVRSSKCEVRGKFELEDRSSKAAGATNIHTRRAGFLHREEKAE